MFRSPSRAAELRAANRQLAAEIRDAHAYVDWLTDEKNKAQRAAEQADARRRNAVTRAWQLADLVQHWREQSYRDRVRADHNAELAYTQRQAALRAEGIPNKRPTVTTLPWTGDDAA